MGSARGPLADRFPFSQAVDGTLGASPVDFSADGWLAGTRCGTPEGSARRRKTMSVRARRKHRAAVAARNDGERRLQRKRAAVFRPAARSSALRASIAASGLGLPARSPFGRFGISPAYHKPCALHVRQSGQSHLGELTALEN